MITRPGKQCTRSQQLLLSSLVEAQDNEVIIIHHVTEDTPRKLQLEIERRLNGRCSFERVVL